MKNGKAAWNVVWITDSYHKLKIYSSIYYFLLWNSCFSWTSRSWNFCFMGINFLQNWQSRTLFMSGICPFVIYLYSSAFEPTTQAKQKKVMGLHGLSHHFGIMFKAWRSKRWCFSKWLKRFWEQGVVLMQNCHAVCTNRTSHHNG